MMTIETQADLAQAMASPRERPDPKAPIWRVWQKDDGFCVVSCAECAGEWKFKSELMTRDEAWKKAADLSHAVCRIKDCGNPVEREGIMCGECYGEANDILAGMDAGSED